MTRVAVNEHGARAALAFAAAVLASRQVKLVAQHAQQGSVRRGVNLVPRAIDLDFSDSWGLRCGLHWHGVSSRSRWASCMHPC